MLLKASPSALLINFKSSFTAVSNSTFFSLNNCSVSCEIGAKSGKRGVAAVGTGYTKRSLETPGAYELVDEESGEKFIVWGGVDDEGPIPTKEVLQWKPNNNNNVKDVSNCFTETSSSEDVLRTHNSDAAITRPGASSKGVSRSFERLRTGRVRDLGRVSSSEKGVKDGDSRSGPNISLHVETLMAKQNRSNVRKDDDAADVDRSISKSKVGEAGGISSKLRKSSAAGDFFSRKSFKDVGCTDYLLQFLNSQLIAYPSHIQAMSFPHVIKGKSCIIADQSGSGKTLAYLLPVIQSIRQDELEGLTKSFPQSPRVVIIVPTAELASQVLRNCRLMSKSGVPFRSMIATGGFKQKTQLENLRNELDVLIATPGRFLYLVQEGFLHLTNLKWYSPMFSS